MKLKKNNKAMIQMLPTIAFAIILLFAVVNIGTYINGTIGAELVDTMPSNTTTHNHDEYYYHNGTGAVANQSRNVSFSTSVATMHTTGTYFHFNANRTGNNVWLNLSINGVLITFRQVTALAWYNVTLATFSSNITTSVSYLNFTWNTSDVDNRIVIRTIGNRTSDYRTTLQNNSVNTLLNLTGSYDSTLDIVVVAAIITVLTIPLMAVVAIKRLF